MSENAPRASFSGKMGLILATSASAVGLGNLWRFPYETSHNGGGIFVLTYLVVALTFGICMFMMEMSFGRRTGKSAISAFAELSKKHSFIGYLMALCPIIIMCYYCVIGGWVLKWFFESVTGNLSALSDDSGAYWEGYIEGLTPGGFGQPIFWMAVFILVAIAFVVMGVTKGIEKTSRFAMPALFVLIIVIIGYEVFAVDGIADGISFNLKPNLDDLSVQTFTAATSQVFYSLSIAMGILITYGSYAKKDVDLEKTATSVCIVDSSVALLAGLMIVPVAFVFGFPDSSGMGLMFVSLPQVFDMMPGGAVIAPLFYLLAAFAAVTSVISMAEVGTSVLFDKSGIDRKKSAVIIAVILIGVGAVCTLGFTGGPLALDLPMSDGMGYVGFLDNMATRIVAPLAAIAMCIFIGYVVKTAYLEEEISMSSKFRTRYVFRIMLRYVAPILLSVILITGLLSMF